jgi:isopenicillin N synthase-like dioxygenase
LHPEVQSKTLGCQRLFRRCPPRGGPTLTTDPTAIPVIDLAPALVGDPGDVIAAVREACTTIGFFLVTGHGVPAATTQTLYDEARRFFDEPHAAKASLITAPAAKGGLAYAALETEALAATRGERTPGDYKESLNFGPQLPGAPWPDPALHAAFAAYFRAMETLAAHLRRLFCAAIGLKPDHFEPAFHDHLSALRVINYPEQPADIAPGQMRAGAHTDYGFLTILRSEASAGGLQVQTRAGHWIDAPNIDGAFVVNIADAFMRWTNDTWLSTPHRVANAPAGARQGSRRQSIPFFLNPRGDTMIECLKPFCGPDRPAKHKPISYADYIALKTSQAFG